MTKWKYNIGDNVIDEKRNFTITDREIKYMDHYKKPCHQKWYKLTCNICGWDEGWKSEKSLCSDKKGCACCRGRVVVKGINDIATKAPYIIPYLLNPEDAYKYTPYSTAIIKTKCPICGEIREYRIAQLTSYPYVCNRCGKHLSVPERFFYEFLKFYNIDFIPQLSSAKMAWCGKYRYDFYIPIINAIIELHGRQHYELGIYKRSYDDIRQRDIEKNKIGTKKWN